MSTQAIQPLFHGQFSVISLLNDLDVFIMTFYYHYVYKYKINFFPCLLKFYCIGHDQNVET